MTTDTVRVLHLGIRVSFDEAYAFACRPESFPEWAAGLSKSLHRTAEGWVAQTPEGEAIVDFSEPNPYGVLDHRVRLPGRPIVSIPLRMVPNGQGTEVELMLFRQPGMDDDAFERDAAAVIADLQALKALLEKRG